MLTANYSIEIDRVGKREWADLLSGFEDANLYQTISYGAIRWGQRNLSHLVLKQYNTPVAVAQVRLVRIPVLGGIAYITAGPIWRPWGQQADVVHLRHMIRALRQEYVIRRGLLLRMLPSISSDDVEAAAASAIFESEGFGYAPRPA